VFQANSTSSWSRARSTMISEARRSLRRWTTVTESANFARKVASSIALSPPPTTRTSSPRWNAPSQVAHVEEAVAHQLVLAVGADPASARAGGDDQPTGSQRLAVRQRELDRSPVHVGRLDGAVAELGAELLGLFFPALGSVPSRRRPRGSRGSSRRRS